MAHPTDLTPDAGSGPADYEPPALTDLGSLAALTLQAPKEIGAMDGSSFLGVDIGDVVS